MKKIFYIIASIALLSSGCEKWLDVNVDPNVPEDVPAYLVLPSTEVSIATRVGGNMFNYGGFFAQYWDQAPEANQYNNIQTYEIKNPFFERDYREFYAGALADLKKIREKSSADSDWGSYLAATVLRAYTFQILVDMMDSAPYLEALQGSDNTAPKFDAGDVIYDGVISEINEALDSLNSASTVPINDLIFKGDMQQWIGFANAMKLRLYMRESYAVDKSLEIKDLISQNMFFTGDVEVNAFVDQVNKHNPWYETNRVGLGTINNVATHTIISYLQAKNDPRLPILFNPAVNTDSYEGNIPSWKSRPGVKNDDFSTPIVAPAQPVYLYTQSELQLFIAEAQLRFNSDDGLAKTAYQNAIDANLSLHSLANDGSELYGAGMPYEWNSSATTDEKLKEIGMQKWVCLCMVDNIEAWTEIREPIIRKFRMPVVRQSPQLQVSTHPEI